MSQIKATLYVGVLALSLAMSGCGDPNSDVVFSSQSGKHPSGWVTGHSSTARADQESCFGCHGENLDGGISKVSCNACHAGGIGAVHPQQWGQFAYARHQAYVATNGTASCATTFCHGTALTGGSGSGPSCATACHLGGTMAGHPAGWTASQPFSVHADYAETNGIAGCSTRACHGTDSRGVFLSGPSCYQCHPFAADNKHPPAWVDISSHQSYVNSNGSATCLTSMCHGTGGTGPSCATSGCHN